MPPPSLTLTPSTELDAVNTMLLSIGKAPVNTLSVSGITEVNIARMTLHNVLRDVLTVGYHFNTENDFPLALGGGGKIAVPTNALSIDPCDESLDLVQRKDPADSVLRLYNRKDHTFVLTKDIKVNVKWFLSFEELPQSARSYIQARAGRTFQTQLVGSQILYAFTAEHEGECLRLLDQEELDSADTNFFRSDPATARIVHRDRY